MWAIHLTATSRVLKSLTSTVGFRGWVAVCGSGNEMDSPLVELAARGAPAGAALGDRGAAGVRDTPSDRALSAPRSRRQARDGRPATKYARRAGPRRRAHDALPGGSQCPPTDFRWRPLTRPRPVRRLPRPQCRHYGRPLRRRSGHSTDRATHGPPVRRGPDLVARAVGAL